MSEKGPEFDGIKVSTVDSMQEKQSSVVILDMVVTDNIDFADSRHRLNVEFSRGMEALVIIAQTTDIMS